MAKDREFKVFWDAVHGQIRVPKIWCKIILDTEHFQRLKRLEQTNSRPLFPCAHHDRFIHSLGTYHLGNFAFSAIKKNSEDDIEDFTKIKGGSQIINWGTLHIEFTLACLLHDVGHAPFSHTFEEFYNTNINNGSENSLNELFTEKARSKYYKNLAISDVDFEEFIKDFGYATSKRTIPINYRDIIYDRGTGSDPKEHEKVSAFLVLKEYASIVCKTLKKGIDSLNIIRMILGVKYSAGFNPDEVNKQVINCFIDLLNGPDIDVDKLDYTTRDQWATGNIFRHIDYQRLLSSIRIKENQKTGLLENCYDKKSINEIVALKQARLILKSKIHSHPIVKYDDHLLKEAVKQTVKEELKKSSKQKINPLENTIEDYVGKIVSVDALIKPVKIKNCQVYLPTDDDLIHILKKHIKKCDYAQEWLSRKYRLKALWKTNYDYKHQFLELSLFERKLLKRDVDKLTREFFSFDEGYKYSLEKPYYIEKDVISDTQYAGEGEINILIDRKIIKLYDLLSNDKDQKVNSDDTSDKKNQSTNTYFLIYLPSQLTQDEILRNKYLEFLRTTIKEYVEIMISTVMEQLKESPSSATEISAIHFNGKTVDGQEKYNSIEEFALFLDHLQSEKKVKPIEDKGISQKKMKYSLCD